MNAQNDIWILIPARNEAASIVDTIQRIRDVGNYSILVVDSLSTDQTSLLAKSMGAYVCTATQIGYWTALQTGYRWLLEQEECRYVVQMDADGQHDPIHLPRIIHQLQQNSGNTWVVGSRFQTGSPSGLLYHFSQLFLRHYICSYGVVDSMDLSSGFWGFQRESLEILLHYNSPFQTADVGIRLFLHQQGIQSKELSTAMDNRETGESMHAGFLTKLRHFHHILRDVRSIDKSSTF